MGEMHGYPQYQREVIYVNKVYNECSLVDCPTYRIPIPPTFPLAVNVVECRVTDIAAEGIVVGPDEVDVVVNFTMSLEYDSNGSSEIIYQTAQYRRSGILLESAVVGMNVVLLPLIRCLGCEVVDGGTAIECSVGVYVIVKVISLVQLEVQGRFPSEPPECEQVSPLGCAEWFEMVEAGDFWPPFPPQIPRPGPPPRPGQPTLPRRV